MKKYCYLFFCMIVLAIIVLDVSAQAWRGRGRLMGSVKDQNDNPLEGVLVKFKSEKLATGTEVKTNKDGKWTLQGIRGGTWAVDFTKEGYKTVAISTGVSEGSYNQPIDMVMEKSEGVAAAQPAESTKIAQARDLLKANNYQGAIPLLQEALAENPAVYKVHAEIAAAYYKLGDNDKAIQNYQAYIEKEKAAGVTTPNVQVRVTLAGIYLEKEDVANAKKYLDGIDESAIKDPTVFYNLGVSYSNAKDYDAAIRYFEKSVAADPKFADGYYQLAVTYVAKNDTAKAVEAFKKVIEVAPNSDAAKEAQEFISLMGSK